MKSTKSVISALLIVAAFSGVASAAEYECLVSKKFDSEQEYTEEIIQKFRYSVKVEDLTGTSFLSRCSVSPSAGKVTCDRYTVDKVVMDSNVRIKKYYHFLGQFDVQIFRDLSFVENNGRAGIAFGKCSLSSP